MNTTVALSDGYAEIHPLTWPQWVQTSARTPIQGVSQFPSLFQFFYL
jgi:hypothetical protein